MLRRLTVKNYAIIRELDMDFGEGFTIITGETGAGKSILVGALGLVLGERADTSVLLSKEEKCVVEADFNIRGYDLEELFEASGLDYDDNAILRREITPAGKSRAFINDTPVTLSIMKELGDRLIDVHSQHQTLLLGTSMFQMRVIDAYAGTSNLFRDYTVVYKKLLAARREYEAASVGADRAKADYEYYIHQLEELNAARLVKGEQEEMEKEQEMLSNAGEIKEALTSAASALSGDDISGLSLLRMVRGNLTRISGWLPEAGELEKRLDATLVDLNDIAYEVEKLNDRTAADPGRLEYVTGRLDTIYSLMQKHRCKDLEELLTRHRQIEENVVTLTDIDGVIGVMKKNADDLYREVLRLAGQMSLARGKAAAPLAG